MRCGDWKVFRSLRTTNGIWLRPADIDGLVMFVVSNMSVLGDLSPKDLEFAVDPVRKQPVCV